MLRLLGTLGDFRSFAVFLLRLSLALLELSCRFGGFLSPETNFEDAVATVGADLLLMMGSITIIVTRDEYYTTL